MQSTTYKVGLTGGIACGKSTVQARLVHHGIPVVDTDRIGHELLLPDSPLIETVRDAFGDGVMDEAGGISRPKLGSIVFSDSESRKRLNDILHPEIRKRWKAWLAAQSPPMAVVAIPLLFECGYENEFDGVLCVTAEEHIMTQRLMARGCTPEEAAQRIQAQWPVDRKAEMSTWTLENNLTLDHLTHEVDRWVQQLKLSEK